MMERIIGHILFLDPFFLTCFSLKLFGPQTTGKAIVILITDRQRNRSSTDVKEM